MKHRPRYPALLFDRRDGAILVSTMWVMIILTGLVLVFARSMRVEALGSANRAASIQAAAIERGAEQYVLSLVDGSNGDTSIIDQSLAEAVPVGLDDNNNPLGYFWFLRPDPDTDQYQAFGIVDEASKLSLNKAEVDQLIKLPGMTQDVAEAIIDWRDEDSNPSQQGAEDDYYLSLPDPYHAKNGPFESVEELMLVRGVTRQMLYGYDFNRDGVVEQQEQQMGGGSTFSINDYSTRGIVPFITVNSIEPAPTTGTTGGVGGSGSSGLGSSSSSSSTTAQRININSQNTQAFQQLLQKSLPADRFNAVWQAVSQRLSPGQGRAPQPFSSIFDFYYAAGLKPDEFKTIAPQILTAPTSGTGVQTGLIDVNRAPREVLLCLPGLEESDVDAMISKRLDAGVTTGGGVSGLGGSSSALNSAFNSGSSGVSMAWLVDALPQQKLIGIGNLITDRSYQFSADIVAVSADGRSYRRCYVVVDARKSPPKIVYRKDLTSWGWPLDPQIRLDLRQGLGVQPTLNGGLAATSGQSSSIR